MMGDDIPFSNVFNIIYIYIYMDSSSNGKQRHGESYNTLYFQ